MSGPNPYLVSKEQCLIVARLTLFKFNVGICELDEWFRNPEDIKKLKKKTKGKEEKKMREEKKPTHCRIALCK